MYYFRKGYARTVAEKPENARRLIAEGWEPCSPAIHEALWRRADVVQRMEQGPVEQPHTAVLFISRQRFLS